MEGILLRLVSFAYCSFFCFLSSYFDGCVSVTFLSVARNAMRKRIRLGKVKVLL